MKQYKINVKNTQGFDYDECRDIEFEYIDMNKNIVGTAKGHLFTLNEEQQFNDTLLDIADSVSQDCYNTTDVLLHGSPLWMMVEPKYFYLDRIIINKEHRNKGIGSLFLQDIEKYIKKKADLLYLQIAPFEVIKDKKEYKKQKSKLKNFYSDKDFDTVHCIDDDIDIAIKIIGE